MKGEPVMKRTIFTTIIISIIMTTISTAIINAEMLKNKAVLHHTASHDVSANIVNEWHKERGWNGIGYHYIIRADGTIEKGRDINTIGAHAKGRNNYIGIALTGYDEFTDAQYKSLAKLFNKLDLQYLQPHHENCPGDNFNWIKLMQEITK